MAILQTNLIEPEGATTTLTIGESGGDLVVGADSIKNNVLKDAGGNAIFTSNGSGVVSGVNAGFGSAMALLSTQNASTSASLSFTSSIDSTYKEYVFEFIAIHPSDTSGPEFQFQANASGQSGYDEEITSSAYYSYHGENGGGPGVAYTGGWDQAQGTSFQPIIVNIGADNDECGVGELHIFNPASTSYVKTWYARGNSVSHESPPYIYELFTSGYIDTASAITEIQFKMSAGNIDSGTIKMYGIK